MKNIKIADTWVSMILIIAFAILSFFYLDYLFIGYFVVGGWQALSMIVHAINGWFTHQKGIRWYYHYFIAALVFLCLIVILFKAFIVAILLAYVMLFLSPILAIGYTAICYYETYYKLKRPLADLM